MKTFLICHRGALDDFILTWPAISFGLLGIYFDNESADLLDFFCGKCIPDEIGSPQGAVLQADKRTGSGRYIKVIGFIACCLYTSIS